MAQPNDLSKVANIANALFNSITSNSTAITAISVGGATSTFGGNVVITGTANVTANLVVNGTSTLSGNSSTPSTVITNTLEPTTVSATAATGTINFDVTTQSVLYYTSNASANWTVNFRGSSGTSLNTLMSNSQSVTVAFMVTQGATAYFANNHQVDGANVTPKWQGGTAPTAGNASGIDIYTYTIIKTGSATFTLLAAQTQFK